MNVWGWHSYRWPVEGKADDPNNSVWRVQITKLFLRNFLKRGGVKDRRKQNEGKKDWTENNREKERNQTGEKIRKESWHMNHEW
jgi:hypothetical protein